MEIPTNIDVNLQLASQTLEQCLKTTAKFSGNLYQNICSGQSYFIANGFWDYVLAISLFTMAVVIIGGLLFCVVREIFNSY